MAGLYTLDPQASPYFSPQEQGSGQYSRGSGNGYDFLDYAQVPGMERFASMPSAGVSGGGDENIAAYLQERGLRVYEKPESGNWVTRGFVDQQGNFVGEPQRMQLDDDRGFWNAALLAAAVVGGATASWANAGNGIGGATAGSEAAASGLSSADKAALFGDAGYGAGMTGVETGAAGGTLGSTAAPAGKGLMDGVSYWDMARTAMGAYGMYQNKQAMDDARDAASRANNISETAANRQAALAEASYDNYLKNIQPGLLEDAAFARARARVTAGQADRLFDEQMDDAGFYRNRWRNTQVPLEDEIIANARKLGTQGEQDRLAGLAVTDVRGNFSDMRAMRERDAQRSGVNLNSGAARALAEEAFMAEALAGANAGTGARFAAMDRYRSGMTDAAALGRGLPGFSSSASGGATNAGGLSINAGNAGVQAGVGTAGAMTSAGNSISNMWGNSSNTAINGFNAVNNFANTVRQSPFSTVAGSVFGDWMGGGKP